MELKNVNPVLRKYMNMSKREKWHQLYSNLWMTPILYALFAIMLFILATWMDTGLRIANLMPSLLTINSELTQTVLSTLTGGLLSLTSFTFYGVLTAVTTFSAQFSPRILKNFMINNVTQRTLGIFCGSFLFVLLCMLFLDNTSIDQYTIVPLAATLLAMVSLGAFVFFINNIVNWLQVSQITADMKVESVQIIENSLLNELDPHRANNYDVVKSQVPQKEGNQVKIDQSGYLQKIEFISLLEEAKRDNVVIKLEYSVGDFVFSSTALFTYWEKADTKIDPSKYTNMFHIGTKQTEIQDIEFSINKFVEIAIRSLGNDDPKTATETIYQIGDLLVHISRKAKSTPYLVDEEENLRLILQNFNFEDYLYIGLASVRHYASDNIIITMQLLKALDGMAHGISRRDYRSIWEFAKYIADGFMYENLYRLDKNKYYHALYNIAETTGNQEDYKKLIQSISERLSLDSQIIP